MSPEIGGRIAGVAVDVVAPGNTGRCVFGPFEPGEVITGLLVNAWSRVATGQNAVSPELTATMDVKVSQEKPRNATGFANNGRSLFGVSGGLPVPFALAIDTVGTLIYGYSSVNYPIRWTASDVERWLTVQFTVDVGDLKFSVIPQVGE